MFDLGAGELLVIGVVALVVIGPKELPGVLRTVGQAVGKLRRMATEFQGQFTEALREADVADATKVITDLGKDVTANFDFSNPPLISPTIPVLEVQPDEDVKVEMAASEPDIPASAVGTEDHAAEGEPDVVATPKKRTRKSTKTSADGEVSPDADTELPLSDNSEAVQPPKKRTRKATIKPAAEPDVEESQA